MPIDSETIKEAVNAIRNTADLEARIDTYAGRADEDDGKVTVPFALLREDERVEVLSNLQSALDQRLPAPARRRGQAVLLDPVSFGHYVNRHKQADTVIFANREQRWLKALFNFHPQGDNPGAAGWCDFVAEYNAPLAPEWRDWSAMDGKVMGQDAFADWIEARFEEVISDKDYAKPIELMEMARDLQIHTAGTFKRKIDPTTGAYNLVCKEEHGDTSTKIPRAFLIGIPVFDGGDAYKVECRIRFKLEGGVPQFSFTMHRRTEIERDAFAGIVSGVHEATGVDVFVGQFNKR